MTATRAKVFRFDTESVLIRRKDDTVVLEPVLDWPEGYAESFAGMPSDVRRSAQGKPDAKPRDGIHAGDWAPTGELAD